MNRIYAQPLLQSLSNALCLMVLSGFRCPAQQTHGWSSRPKKARSDKRIQALRKAKYQPSDKYRLKVLHNHARSILDPESLDAYLHNPGTRHCVT